MKILLLCAILALLALSLIGCGGGVNDMLTGQPIPPSNSRYYSEFSWEPTGNTWTKVQGGSVALGTEIHFSAILADKSGYGNVEKIVITMPNGATTEDRWDCRVSSKVLDTLGKWRFAAYIVGDPTPVWQEVTVVQQQTLPGQVRLYWADGTEIQQIDGIYRIDQPDTALINIIVDGAEAANFHLCLSNPAGGGAVYDTVKYQAWIKWEGEYEFWIAKNGAQSTKTRLVIGGQG